MYAYIHAYMHTCIRMHACGTNDSELLFVAARCVWKFAELCSDRNLQGLPAAVGRRTFGMLPCDFHSFAGACEMPLSVKPDVAERALGERAGGGAF